MKALYMAGSFLKWDVHTIHFRPGSMQNSRDINMPTFISGYYSLSSYQV